MKKRNEENYWDIHIRMKDAWMEKDANGDEEADEVQIELIGWDQVRYSVTLQEMELESSPTSHVLMPERLGISKSAVNRYCKLLVRVPDTSKPLLLHRLGTYTRFLIPRSDGGSCLTCARVKRAGRCQFMLGPKWGCDHCLLQQPAKTVKPTSCVLPVLEEGGLVDYDLPGWTILEALEVQQPEGSQRRTELELLLGRRKGQQLHQRRQVKVNHGVNALD